jgi:hypothetical protein
MDVLDGRWTVDVDDDEFVVFLIGAKVRNPIRAWRALPMLGQMNKMLADLSKDPDKGLLAYQRHGGPFGVIVQYWRSFDALEAFARDTDDRHAQVWRQWFRKAQHQNAAVGIWHETYAVKSYEAIYQNMPAIGLGKAGRPRPVNKRSDSARERAGLAVPVQAGAADQVQPTISATD